MFCNKKRLKNDFNVNLEKSDLGAFSHVDIVPGRKLLASNVGEIIKKYKIISLPNFVVSYYVYGSMKKSYFTNLLSDDFLIQRYLINNKVTMC